MPLRFTLIPCALVISVCLCQVGLAQTTGTTGMTGGFGSGLTGSGTAGLSSTGSSGITSGTGTSGTGSTGTGATGTTGANATGSTAAQTFVGGNATQAFVGGGLQGTQPNSNRQFQSIQDMQSQTGTQGQTTGTPREIRTTMSIGFSFPTATAAQTSGRLSRANSVSLIRFTASRPEFSGISVAMTSQGVAVLTGSTLSTESKRLAANLIRLQPGVRKVDNQVAVN